MSLPNLLTFSRLIITPLFLLIYLFYPSISVHERFLPFILLALFVIAEMTDFFDGYVARKYGQVTELGKILDPMADSIFRISLFLTFTQPPVNLSIIPVFVIIYRDSVVSTVRTICALKGFTLAARTSGKLKAVIQAIAAFIVLVLMTLQTYGMLSKEELQKISCIVVSIAALYTLLSGVEYLYANRLYLYKTKSL